tara:strand:+ start:31779 stop:31925 length:147 start_codon:yes stop_codon:yes gene_type:complete
MSTTEKQSRLEENVFRKLPGQHYNLQDHSLYSLHCDVGFTSISLIEEE